jgi:hypothetical protein
VGKIRRETPTLQDGGSNWNFWAAVCRDVWGMDFGVDVHQDSGGLCKQDLGRLF